MSDNFQGTAREMGGRVQQKLGEVVGDTKTQAEGLYNEAAGRAQQQVGVVTDMIKEQPLASALIAAGVGYLIGRLTS